MDESRLPASQPPQPFGGVTAKAFEPPAPTTAGAATRLDRPPPAIPWWPAPAPSNPWLLTGAVAISVLAAATLLEWPGAQWPALALCSLLLIRFCCPRPAPRTLADQRWRALLSGIALALLGTLAVRDSGPLMLIVIMAFLALLAVALTPSGRAVAVLAAPLLGAVAWCRGLIWLPVVPRTRWRLPAQTGPALRGTGLAAVLFVVVGALLVSADQAFAGLAQALLPEIDLDGLPIRVVLAGLSFTVICAVTFGVASPPGVFGPSRFRQRPAAEWVLPVGALVAVLGVFLVVQAAVLFDAYPSELVHGDLTPAARAREGFGQLVCVSIIVAGTLAWAAARVASHPPVGSGGQPGTKDAQPTTRGDQPGTKDAQPGTKDAQPGTKDAQPGTEGARPGTQGAQPGTESAQPETKDAQRSPAARLAARDRRVLIVGGGLLLLELEILVASALRRMYLYEETFGWTRLRVEVAAFEIWLALVVLVAAGLWLAGRGPMVPRVGAATAGVALCALALIGPDAIVARGSVDRFHATGKIDTWYLRSLSADAVPSLDSLPASYRACALANSRDYSTPWYAVNLSRLRADAVLKARPAADDACPPGT